MNLALKLKASARGYRVPGRKLLSTDEADYQFGRSNRERKQRAAAEFAHIVKYNADHGYVDVDTYARRVESACKALSARRASYVDRVFKNAITSDDDITYRAAFVMLGNAQWRYFNALHNAYYAELARMADERLYSYAV